jgi:hypothetical protein
MDWSSHMQKVSSEVKEEVDANRKAGYLDKVDFLKRVDERKDKILEKGSSRRKR